MKISEGFTQWIFVILTGVLMIYITVETIELIYQMGKSMIAMSSDSTRLLITKEQTHIVLPVFFNILIAVELIDTLNVFIKDHSLKVQSILLIGLIAIGRKLLVLDVGHLDGWTNIGLASLILALAVGYYLVKKPNKEQQNHG